MVSKILVPVDGSDSSNRTVHSILAGKQHLQASLTLLHVVNVDKLAYRMIPDFQIDMIREHARKSGEILLQEQAARFAAAGITCATRLELGSPREIICRVANEEGYELVILGRRGMGEIRDALFGAVSNYVLHHVQCPVLLI